MVAHRCIIAALLTIVSLLLSSGTTTSTTTWFREKYNEQTYQDYYDYSISRYNLRDNNRDTCPDFHTSASIFAITGQQIQRVTRTCSSLYVKKGTSSKANAKYTQLIEGTVMDVVEFIGVFMCYFLEFAMLLVSLILLFWSTVFMVILVFCQ